MIEICVEERPRRVAAAAVSATTTTTTVRAIWGSSQTRSLSSALKLQFRMLRTGVAPAGARSGCSFFLYCLIGINQTVPGIVYRLIICKEVCLESLVGLFIRHKVSLVLDAHVDAATERFGRSTDQRSPA